ncbi:hypothetical protein OIU78_013301 [Salix suchowensis]|nr:hypothetical protein OIU78_013301 [Salix suchowensis]
MPSRHLSPGFDHPRPSFLTKTRILFLTLTISASVVLIFTILYFVYHLWHTLVNRSRTIPFDAKREFQNELQILGGLRSPFLVILLGYCVEKNKRLLVYEYVPNKSLQELLFGDGHLSLCWERSQDLGKSQELWKSQELSGNLTPETPAIGTPVESCHEVDFALALQASSSSKKSRTCYNVKALNLSSLNYNANIPGESDVKVGNGKGKEVSSVDIGGDDWNCRFVPYDDEFCSNDHSKELNCNSSSVVDDSASSKQWGKDWWWRQDGSGELCSKDYVMEWIGSQICPSANPDWEDEKKSTQERTESRRSVALDKLADANEPPRLKDFKFDNLVSGFEKKETKGRKNRRKKNRKMQEWWKEEHLDEINKKRSKLKNLETKWRKGFKIPHFDLGRRFRFHRRKKLGEQNQNDTDQNGEFSFQKRMEEKDAICWE